MHYLMKVCIFKDSVKTYKVLQDQETKDLKFHFKIYMKYLLITNITSKKKRTVGTMLCDNWSDYFFDCLVFIKANRLPQPCEKGRSHER